MNPKQEFVKAIMQVLRLEADLYTMGAIESIIERLEVKDYTMFIAFLGERASDYEKPIQSIAKGVEEFYTIKIEPMERAYDTKAREVSTMVYAYVAAHGHDGMDDCNALIGLVFSKQSGGDITFSVEDAGLIKSVGGLQKYIIHDHTADLDALRQKIKEFLLKDIVKPSITQKIKNQSEATATKTLALCNTALKRVEHNG